MVQIYLDACILKGVRDSTGQTSCFLNIILLSFYSATTAYMLSALHAIVRPSVRLSVTRLDQSKAVEDRIMKFLPYSNPISLVFAR